MRLPIFAAVLATACLAATSTMALSWSPISQTQSRVDFSRTTLQPTAWAVSDRARYQEAVTLANGQVIFTYSESEALTYRDSDPVGFGAWFRTLSIDGIPADDMRLEIRERTTQGGPTMYNYVSSADRTCIAFRVGAARIMYYNRRYPGHEALLLGVLCEQGVGGATEEALLNEAGHILVKY